jgi:hypothetical protein
MAPDSLQIDHTIRKLLEEGRGSFQQFSTTSSNVSAPGPRYTSTSAYFSFPDLHFSSVSEAFSFYWQIVFMRSILLLFLLSCITQFAQYYQLILDREDSQKLRERLPRQIIDDIKSPISGQLKLPPPSTRKKRKPKKTQTEKLSILYDRPSVDAPINPSSPTRRLRSNSSDRLTNVRASPRKHFRSTPATPERGAKILQTS